MREIFIKKDYAEFAENFDNSNAAMGKGYEDYLKKLMKCPSYKGECKECDIDKLCPFTKDCFDENGNLVCTICEKECAGKNKAIAETPPGVYFQPGQKQPPGGC
ncbi:MAG: hypothetical protein FWC15_05180 [Fibromonadales bacterium]|nr:hypothetical protein [Fibromonadales bacterium]